MKKVLVMFLLICLLLPIASCIGGGGGSEPTTTTKDENSCGGWPPPPPPTEGYVYKGYVSWNGMAYRSDDLAWLYNDTPDKDSISASVYYRNQAIQWARGCTVIDRAQAMDSVYEEWSSFQNNGEKFEVAVMGAKTSALLAADGYLHDLDIIAEYTKGSIEDEIFDQNSVKELEIKDHLYYVAGDMNLSPFNNSPATVFNVDLFSEWKNTITEELGDGYGDLYKMVEDGTWTLEAMLSIADLVTYDVVTNDGALSYEKGDTIGYFAYSASPVFHWFGEGMRIARQIDGEITMDGVCNTIKAGQTYNALFEIFNQPVAGSKIPMGDSAARREEFNSGNVLFA
ncbi:MAG: hypothetical protein IJX13_06280, partial [Clostridia bacterium]|nr:hypothetical protein [Clostridia bacterium]